MSDYNRLSGSDLQTDCAEEMPGSRVPTIGLHGGYDDVDGAPMPTNFQKHGQNVSCEFDSGLGSIGEMSVTSLADKMDEVQITQPAVISEVPKEEIISLDEGVVPSLNESISEEERRKLEIAHQIFNPDEDGDTKLHLAIIQKRADLIEQCIYFCPDPHWLTIQNFLQQSPLHLAILTNQADVARKLLANGSSLEMRDRNGNTPLHLACKMGLGECVEALTYPITDEERQNVPQSHQLVHRMPQDMSIKNYEGETCLHLAACVGHTNLVHFLVNSCHADINSQEGKSGRTILHQAVENNNSPLVQYLLQHPGVDLEALTYDLSTPLQLACGRRHANVMSMLIQSGADRSRIREDDSTSESEDEMELDNSSLSHQYISSMIR